MPDDAHKGETGSNTVTTGCNMLGLWLVATAIGTLFVGVPFLRANDSRK